MPDRLKLNPLRLAILETIGVADGLRGHASALINDADRTMLLDEADRIQASAHRLLEMLEHAENPAN